MVDKKYIIYKLKCTNPMIGNCYIGHTVNFNNRKRVHKNDCTTEGGTNYHFKVYQFIREHGGWDAWEMVPIDEVFGTKTQARIREQYWMNKERPDLNTNDGHMEIENIATEEELKILNDDTIKSADPRKYKLRNKLARRVLHETYKQHNLIKEENTILRERIKTYEEEIQLLREHIASLTEN
jgi:polyhydroxyalkanoate synthesis regulator phasin